jgi:uncharacterized protein
MRWLFAVVAVTFVAVTSVAPAVRQAPGAVPLTRTEHMIAMRDGIRLYTQVYMPNGATEPLPIIFTRTPYGIGQNTAASVAAALTELLADGNIIGLQDIRGRFKSEGPS